MKMMRLKGAGTEIFIAMPVFNGAEFVRETLDCVRAQTFQNYRVLISIDGGDERSAAACASYARDPRFEIVVQKKRLGFKGNLNWLIERASGEYFCFWQQDDLTEENYLQVLHDWAEEHPQAACVYSDIQWFGTRSGREERESIVGPVQERLWHALNGYHWVAIRGLIRSDAMRRAGKWPETPFNGDFLWTVKLAGAGEMHRVRGTHYYKRAHSASASAGSHALVVDPSQWRDLVAFASYLFHSLGPLISSNREYWRVLGHVVAKLLAPPAVRLFAVSGFSENDRRRLLLQLGDELAPRSPRGMGAAFKPAQVDQEDSTVGRDLREVMQWSVARQRAFAKLAVDDPVMLGVAEKDGNEWLLREGWSKPEPWGVWSIGEACRISVPIPSRMEVAQVTLRLHAYVPIEGIGRQVFIQVGNTEPQVLRFDTGAVHQFRADIPRNPSAESRLIDIGFRTPGSVSPFEAGVSGDPRKLAIGLHGVQVGTPT